MVNEYQVKEQICEIGRRVDARGLVAANDGNISVKVNGREVLCTPTGVLKGTMTPDMICKMDLDGNVLEAPGGYKPSSEMKMHLRVYQKRPDIGAVVHAHPPYATSFAVAGIPTEGTGPVRGCGAAGRAARMSRNTSSGWPTAATASSSLMPSSMRSSIISS